jgi:hypothetical protein
VTLAPRPGDLPWIALAVAILSTTGGQDSAAQESLPWDDVAQHIVARLSLNPGERVLLVCHPGRADQLVPPLRYAVMEAGATDLGCLEVLDRPYPDDWDRAVVTRAWLRSREALRQILGGVDVAIMLPGAWPTEPAYVAFQELLYRGQGRAVHFHWHGGFDLTGRQLPVDDRISQTYLRAVLDTDYRALAAAQQAFERAARVSPIRVTTPAGTDISFRIGDRPVTRQDGDASAARAAVARNLVDREVELPAGALRVAPLEESVQGVIVLPVSRWQDTRVDDLRIKFEGGLVVAVEAAVGVEAALAELDEGGTAARYLREFALGFNPHLAVPEEDPWIPHYGYGAGVVRLSLGENQELGGAVRGDYNRRWNFFTDATVYVGEKTWVRDGKLVR